MGRSDQQHVQMSRIDELKINGKVLMNYVGEMNKRVLTLDYDAVNKLTKLGLRDNHQLANYCFNAGWKEATKHLLQLLSREEIKHEQNKISN